MLLINNLIERFLRTGVVGETLVHRHHVLLLRGEDGATCRQQLVARRDTFEESLKRRRRRRKVRETAPPAGVVEYLLPGSPPGRRDTPGSNWLSPPRSAHATSCSRQSKAARLHRGPPHPQRLPVGNKDTL